MSDLSQNDIDSLVNSINETDFKIQEENKSTSSTSPFASLYKRSNKSIKEHHERKFNQQLQQKYTPPRKDDHIIYKCGGCNSTCTKITVFLGLGKKKYSTYCSHCDIYYKALT